MSNTNDISRFHSIHNVQFPIHDNITHGISERIEEIAEYDVKEDDIASNVAVVYTESDESELANDGKCDVENVFIVNDYQCAICLEVFVNEAALQIHRTLYDDSDVQFCSFCNQSFHTKRLWSEHVQTHVKSKQFICVHCLNCFTSSDDLQAHLLSVHTEKIRDEREPKLGLDDDDDESEKFECALCGKTYYRKRNIQIHLLTHREFKRFLCYVCGKAFSSRLKVNDHMCVHEQPNTYSCDTCPKTFMAKNSLRRHKRIHTSNGANSEKRAYLCNICNKFYSSKGSLVIHSRIHNGQKPFVCDVCNKSFPRRDRLESHSRVHGGEGLYPCTICGKSISRRENFKYHMRLHTGEKPFPCTECDKCFPSQTALKKHQATHTTNILFTCPICHRSIARKDNFIAHLRIHSMDTSTRKKRLNDVSFQKIKDSD